MTNNVTEKIFTKLFNKNRLKFLGITFCYFFLYTLLFWLGQDTADDRINYFRFFDNPEASRFEPLFVSYGKLTNFLGLSPEISLYIAAAFMFICAAWAISLHLKVDKPYTSFIIFFLLFFGISVLYSFFQIRAGIAIWFALVLHGLYHKTNKKIYIWLLFLPVLIHYSTIIFMLCCFAIYVLKFNRTVLGILSLIPIIITAVFFNQFLDYVESFNPYYLHYFEESTRVITSFTVLSFFGFLCFLPLFKESFDYNKYFISFLSIPVLFFALILNFDVFVKFAFPLMLLFWMGGLKAFMVKNEPTALKQFIYVNLIILLFGSILYATLKSKII